MSNKNTGQFLLACWAIRTALSTCGDSSCPKVCCQEAVAVVSQCSRSLCQDHKAPAPNSAPTPLTTSYIATALIDSLEVLAPLRGVCGWLVKSRSLSFEDGSRLSSRPGKLGKESLHHPALQLLIKERRIFTI